MPTRQNILTAFRSSQMIVLVPQEITHTPGTQFSYTGHDYEDISAACVSVGRKGESCEGVRATLAGCVRGALQTGGGGTLASETFVQAGGERERSPVALV